MSSRTLYSSQFGMTLVEMVIAIAIAGIAIAGLTSSFSSIVGRTADPMILTQAQISAESLMEEILLKPFADPNTGLVCTTNEAARADKNDVCDYQGYTSSGITDQNDNPVVGLENYDVSVTVVSSAFGSAPVVPASASLLVTVTVTNPLGSDVVLSAYRTQ
ncbi:prepilin-type N-terminal cleavage/methylation domain-containing protein [Litoribacillus peritrichatus]|uniref:Prepilin-type N-terminal cleavage/methylation domain-containing protein n=1 Tax=Litoribacillus peritrichatus TaxID=718191 RepID=A0ABP7MSR0_9GAMM